MTYRFTEFQSGEIAHKLGVIAEEPDLQESYGVSEEETEAVLALFRVRGAIEVELSERWAEIIAEELEDAIEVQRSNTTGHADIDQPIASYVSSISGAIRKLRA